MKDFFAWMVVFGPIFILGLNGLQGHWAKGFAYMLILYSIGGYTILSAFANLSKESKGLGGE